MTAHLLDAGGLGLPLPTPQHHALWSSPMGAPSTPGGGYVAWPSTTT